MQDSTRFSRINGKGSNALAASRVLTIIHNTRSPVKEKINAQLPANLAMASAARWPRVYFSAEGLTDILLSASRFSTSSSDMSWRMSLRTSFRSFLFSFMGYVLPFRRLRKIYYRRNPWECQHRPHRTMRWRHMEVFPQSGQVRRRRVRVCRPFTYCAMVGTKTAWQWGHW